MGVIGHSAYFADQVQSLASVRHGRKFSVGIVHPGSYHFGTGAAEKMTVTSGELEVKIKGKETFQLYPAGTSFEVAANSGFDCKAEHPASYHCEYL
ncbi:RmlC-like cupin domain-containing protein [Pelagophyceae sp. CCMP2097]|nr:RmlC-like cupin domain-containing protein [Pelagophyceae sp. CCMP2097]